MARDVEQRAGKTRRLIAGLRISQQDEALLDAVRPFFPEVETEGELAYRLWRRGLELTLAELAALGTTLPAGLSEEQLATLSAQRVVLLLPLLRRTGKLHHLGLEPLASFPPQPLPSALPIAIDEAAASVIVDLGGAEFL